MKRSTDSQSKGNCLSSLKKEDLHTWHILRGNTPVRDIIRHIQSLKPGPKASKPANILKTYRKDLISDNGTT